MLLALLLILAGLAGAIAPQTVAAKEFVQIKIGGMATTENFGTYYPVHIPGLKSGWIEYFTTTLHTKRALHLHDVVLEGDIEIEGADLTVVLYGKSSITGSITGTKDIRITDESWENEHSLRVEKIYSRNGDILIDGNCSVQSRRDIRSEEGYVTIKNATLHVLSGYISADDGINMEGVSVLYGYPGRYNEILEMKFEGPYQSHFDKSKMYYLVNWAGIPLREVIIGPSGAPSSPKIESEYDIFMGADSETTFPAIGGDIKQEFYMYSSTLHYSVWTLQVVEKPDWIVDWQRGDGELKNKTVLRAAPNYGEARSGDVVFLVNGFRKTYKVSQLGGADPSDVVVELTPREVSAEAGGKEFDATIRNKRGYMSLEKYPFSLDAEHWLTITSGDTHGNLEKFDFHIKVAPNTGPERKGTVIFVTSRGTEVMTIHQAAGGDNPEPKPEPKFTLEPKELKVDADGGKKEVTLSCNVLYYVSHTDKPDWLSVSGYINGYTKSQTLTITVNDNTGGKREGMITFKTSEGDVTLKVTQEGGGTKPEPEKPTLTLSISFKGDGSAIPAGGGTKEVIVKSNAEWSASLPKDCKWLTLDKDGGTNDGTLTLTAKENTAYEPRKVTLTVSLDEGDKSQTLEITQAANPKPVLELEQENVVTGPLGSAREVKIRSNVAWKATPTVAWLHVKPSEGTGSKSATLTITADENTAEKGRTGTITIESTDGSKLTRTLTVAQKPAAVAATGISLNPASMTMGSGGGMVGFNVYASKGWTISGSPDWMHPDATRGSGTRLVIVRFDRNESGAERTGKLTVKSDDGKAEKVFTLTQRASQRKPTRPSDDGTYDYDLAIGAEEITVGPSEGAGSSISVATSRLWAGSTTEDWIRLESAVGRGNGSFTFSLAANPSKEMRHGTITVRTQQGLDELKVAIHQQGRVGDEEAPTRVKVSSVSLDPSSITVNGDIRSKLIGASVYPSNAANKGLLWMSSNPSVATVHVADTRAGLRSGSLRADEAEHTADDYAVVTIVGKGKATIAATASDGSGIVARCEVNVLSTVANTVPYAPQAKVYTVGPTLYLSLPTAETVQVYTLAGTLYRTWQAPAGDTSVTLPLGTYIIKVGHLTEKVVVR